MLTEGVHARERDPGRKRRPAPKGVFVRDMELGDEPALLSLWRELMDYHVALDRRFALAHNANQAFLSYVETARARDDYRVRLAVCAGEAVGFSVSCILPNSPVYRTRWIGYINDLAVTNEFRSRGVGALLVKDAITWLRDMGADSIEVYVARKNEVAQKFWRGLGANDYLDRMTISVDQDPPDHE